MVWSAGYLGGVVGIERERILAVLPGAELEHVGPLIDMLLVVEAAADEASYVPALESAGYRVTSREGGGHQRRSRIDRQMEQFGRSGHCRGRGADAEIVERASGDRGRRGQHRDAIGDRRVFARAQRVEHVGKRHPRGLQRLVSSCAP